MSWSIVLEPQNSAYQYVMCMWIYAITIISRLSMHFEPELLVRI